MVAIGLIKGAEKLMEGDCFFFETIVYLEELQY